MSENEKNEIDSRINSPNASIRQDLVDTAVRFLKNPRVLKSSLIDQQRFLKKKGLNDDEIRTACEKSGVYDSFFELQKSTESTPSNTYSIQVKFIEPFLFGSKKTSIEESLEGLEKHVRVSFNEMQTNIEDVKQNIERISQGSERENRRQLMDLKNDIGTIKGLLLNRNQFPKPKNSILRSSIPAWQKTGINADSDPDSETERKGDDIVEICSGASSEPEHNTKNSDSSLEIISYTSKDCDSDFQSNRSTKNDDTDKE